MDLDLYIIMQGANTSALDAIAVKGGTGAAFVIGQLEPAAGGHRSATRAASDSRPNASCDFPLPNQGPSIRAGDDPPTLRAAAERRLCRNSRRAPTAARLVLSTTTRRPRPIISVRARARTVQVDNAAKVDIYPRLSVAGQTMWSIQVLRDCPPANRTDMAVLPTSHAPGESAVKFRARWHVPSRTSRWRRTRTSDRALEPDICR